jgi:molecular chaperone GrpE
MNMEDTKDLKETEISQTDEHVVEEHKKEKRNKHKEQVEALETEIKALKDKMLRNAAELENFKKRMTNERIQDRKFASKSLIDEILTPLEQMNKVVNMPTDNDMLKNF